MELTVLASAYLAASDDTLKGTDQKGDEFLSSMRTLFLEGMRAKGVVTTEERSLGAVTKTWDKIVAVLTPR